MAPLKGNVINSSAERVSFTQRAEENGIELVGAEQSIRAVARVLRGEAEPTGRLPVTL